MGPLATSTPAPAACVPVRSPALSEFAEQKPPGWGAFFVPCGGFARQKAPDGSRPGLFGVSAAEQPDILALVAAGALHQAADSSSMIPKTQQKEKLLKDMSNERYRETRIAPKRTPPHPHPV